MRAVKLSALAAALVALAFGPTRGDAGQVRPLLHVQTGATTAPGEGAFCALAIYSVVAEVGRNCFAGQNPAAQAELDRSVGRLKAYILANDKTYTPDAMDQFMREKGGVGFPKDQLCSSSTAGLYQTVAPKVANVKAYIDALTAEPAAPTWGDCLED